MFVGVLILYMGVITRKSVLMSIYVYMHEYVWYILCVCACACAYICMCGVMFMCVYFRFIKYVFLLI